MKDSMRKLFSLSGTDSEQIIVKQEKIELVSCPLREMMCNVHLSSVNKSYTEAEQHRKEKNFNSSIDTLKSAFYKTVELMDHPCIKCAHHYHTNIIDSLENIHDELEKITSGIFGDKRYHPIYLKAINVIKEFENLRLSNKFQLNDSKDRFLGNYLN
jgi:hypothetical protein